MAEIKQQTRGGVTIAQFQALQDFVEPRFNNSQYVKGLTYRLRAGNTELAEILQEEWIPQGKVKMI